MSRNKTCLVSVVVPMYNAEKYIGECIESVRAQSFRDWELLVVDDGSRDRSSEIVEAVAARDDRVRLLRHPGGANLGVSNTRNRGIAEASGGFIAFLDADDAFEPAKLERQVALMASHPECVMCHTGIRVVVERPADPGLSERMDAYSGIMEREINEYFDIVSQYQLLDRPLALRSNRVCNSSVMAREAPLRSSAVATKQLFQYEDFAQWALLSVHGPFLCEPEPLTRYRVHGDSSTSQLLGNSLKAVYSHMECLLVILALADDARLRGLAESELLESLSRAMDLYAGLNPDWTSDRRDASTSPPGLTAEALWERRSRHLESKLAAVTRQLDAIRDSKAYRISQGIRRMAKMLGLRRRHAG
jgi:glycosyltransferase involved in cell wall biosynthesis